MKTLLRLNRQPRHTLARLGLIGLKPGNLPQHARARARRAEKARAAK